MMLRNIFKKLLFFVVWLILIFDLTLAYWMFFNAYWIEVFVKSPDLGIAYVHSWGTGDTVGLFLIIVISGGIYWLACKTWFPKMKPKNLKAFRKSITVITGFVVLCNMFFIYNVLITSHFQKHWNIREMMEIDGIFLALAYLIGEILILMIIIAFQVGLGYLTYKAWISKTNQPQAELI